MAVFASLAIGVFLTTVVLLDSDRREHLVEGKLLGPPQPQPQPLPSRPVYFESQIVAVFGQNKRS